MIDSTIFSPPAYKCLLDVVRCETLFTKSAERNPDNDGLKRLDDVVVELVGHVDLLSKKLSESNWSDLQAFTNHFLRCLNRLYSENFFQLLVKTEELGLLVNASMLKTKLDISLASCLGVFFKVYLSTNSSQVALLPFWNSEQLDILRSIIGHVAVEFETLKNILSKDSVARGTSLTSDQEILVGHLFDALSIVMVSLFSTSTISDKEYFLELGFCRHNRSLIEPSIVFNQNESFAIHVRGQFVHSCIVFLTHKSKELSSKACRCLLTQLALSDSVHDIHFWRNSFPGIFSGIWSACKQDIAR
jgi:hypothetical protein